MGMEYRLRFSRLMTGRKEILKIVSFRGKKKKKGSTRIERKEVSGSRKNEGVGNTAMEQSGGNLDEADTEKKSKGFFFSFSLAERQWVTIVDETALGERDE